MLPTQEIITIKRLSILCSLLLSHYSIMVVSFPPYALQHLFCFVLFYFVFLPLLSGSLAHAFVYAPAMRVCVCISWQIHSTFSDGSLNLELCCKLSHLSFIQPPIFPHVTMLFLSYTSLKLSKLNCILEPHPSTSSGFLCYHGYLEKKKSGHSRIYAQFAS